MPRLDNSTLPDKDELSQILQIEAARELPATNYDIHFPDFSLFKQLLVHLDISTEIIDDSYFDIHQIVSKGSLLLDTLVPLLLAHKDNQTQQLLDSIYDYLSEQDSPKKSDLLFVFGARTDLRADKAIELYAQHLADRILVSGGNPIYHSGESETEADRYKEILINAGVPGEVITVENKSITVPDNVRRSLNLLEETSSLPRSIIIVNSPYAQRRGWSVLKKHLPKDTVIYRVNSKCATEYEKDNWYKQEKTLRIILSEFIKMKASVAYNTA
jgi:hypothetical protein